MEVDKIVPSRCQPRKDFDPERLAELAGTIDALGLMNPLVVRKTDEGGYELVSGERRLRAVRDILKWDRVTVRLMTVDDAKMRESALVENLQREDLNPIEAALSYQALQKELNLTHENIAERLKVTRSVITNSLRLLELPEEVKQMVASGALASGKARALLGLDNPLEQIKLARRIEEEDISTRRVEQLVAERKKDRSAPAQTEKPRPVHIADLEDRLRRHFASKVKVEDNAGKGRIILEYYSVDEAQRLLDRMGLPQE
ncbi:MAG: ParB/RepB/Spo0J family partition protein [Planctomycetes bacterium]|nr:ParB/RepB/Spo0J family partition protein [Planctomycetota bacterium]